MARRVFFSFHYQRDVWRASIVRNSESIIAEAPAGFYDASIWEKAKTEGDKAVKALIDNALIGTSVTAVLIGAQTANRKYVNYEIDESIKRGNGILGVRIHNIKNQKGETDYLGSVPQKLIDDNYPVYTWKDSTSFAEWVEKAYEAAIVKKTAKSSQRWF